MKTLSQTARRVLRALIALALVAWLAHRVGVGAIADQLARAQIPLALAATLLLAFDSIAKAWNWQQLLAANVDGQPVRLARAVVWFFAGGFIGAVVPSSASTDACRVLLAARGLGGHAAASAASIVTLNALGWLTGCILGLTGIAILVARNMWPPLLAPVSLVFAGTLVLLPAAYGLLAARRERVTALINRIGRRWSGLRRGLAKFIDALLVFEHAHVRFPGFVLVAAAGLLAQCGMFALTASAIGIALPFPVWMVLVPLTRIVALIPVSIADFGLIQAAHVSVLSLFGVPPWESFALSTLFAVQGLLIHSTLGSSAFLLDARRERPQALRSTGT